MYRWYVSNQSRIGHLPEGGIGVQMSLNEKENILRVCPSHGRSTSWFEFMEGVQLPRFGEEDNYEKTVLEGLVSG